MGEAKCRQEYASLGFLIIGVNILQNTEMTDRQGMFSVPII